MHYLHLFLILSASIQPGWPMFGANEQRTGCIAGHSHFSDSAEKKWDLLIQNSEADIIYSGPVSADFTGDGKNDVLIGSFGPMYPVADLYNGPDGAVIWTTLDTNGIGPYFCTPALMDINNDGKPEIFENAAESIFAATPQGYFGAFNGNDGALLWKKKIMYCDSMWSGIQGGWCAPLVIEGDSGTVITGDDEGVIRAFNATNGDIRWIDTLPINLQPPSRGDVDGDGNKEIIVVGGNTLYAFSDSGVLKWNIPMGDSATAPALANLDTDPELEIIVYCHTTGTIKAFNSNNSTPFISMGVGAFTPDWSPETFGVTPWWPPSPALADLTGDGTPDIIIHNGKGLCCVNGATGALEWNKTHSNLFGSPAIADMDNDSYKEIIVTGLPPDTAHRSQVNCFDHNGDKQWGWNSPRGVGGYRDPILNQACLSDVDGDGDLEIAVADYSCYCAVLDIPGGAIEEKSNIKNQNSKLTATPNPFVNSTTIQFNVGGRSGLQTTMSFSIYDISGKLVDVISVNPPASPLGGFHNQCQSVSFGKNLKSGIYFIRVGNSNPVKIIKTGAIQ